MMKKAYLLLVPIALGFAVYGAFFFKPKNFNQKLPFYGAMRLDSVLINGSYKKDTIYHTVPDFKLLSQDGKEVSQANFNGRIYVTDFFFTTCKSICPIMSTNMGSVVDRYKTRPDVLFLSHTVNPQQDTVEAMNAYARKHKASVGKWYFVTGDKKQIYNLARNGYLLSASEGSGSAEDFIHTQNFALIDKEKRIRGFYDGTDSLEIKKLIKDIEVLLASYTN